MKSVAINTVVLPILLALILAFAAACSPVPKPGSRLPQQKQADPKTPPPVVSPLKTTNADVEIKDMQVIERDLKASSELTLDGTESFKLALAMKSREELKSIDEKLGRLAVLGAAAKAKGDTTTLVLTTSAERTRAWVRDRIARVDEYRDSVDYGVEINWKKWHEDVEFLNKKETVQILKLKFKRVDRSGLTSLRLKIDKAASSLKNVIRGRKAMWQFDEADRLAAQLKDLREYKAALNLRR